MTTKTEDESQEVDVNTSRLRGMATRGKKYREDFDTEYMGETMELVLKPVISKRFLPIAAILENKMDMDDEEAQKALEKEADEDGSIDPSNFDEEFISIMSELAVRGIALDAGFAKGETEDGLREIFAISDDDTENIGLIGGVVLEIAEAVLSISSDAEKAQEFRRDGGSE